MQNASLNDVFRQNVENKYQIYNALFMSLPYDKMTNIGMLLPFLYEESRTGYEKGQSPEEIMEEFFTSHTTLSDSKARMELLFKLVQYIERQVVLFDSIEDAAFEDLHPEGSYQDLEKLLDDKHLPEDKLKGLGVRVVFTAHPTQFYPNAVQRILHDLRSAISKDDIAQIDMLLQQLGKTPFVNKTKPSPLDEALSIIYYLRYVYYDSLGQLYTTLKERCKHRGITLHRPLELGFWPGGDRDGNPFVTTEITRQVAKELKLSVLKSYYNHLKEIRRRLTFRGVEEKLTVLSNLLYKAITTSTEEVDTPVLMGHIEGAMEVIRQDHNGLFLNLLEDLRDRVELFGVHFATLDIRQDSRVHQSVMDEILRQILPGYQPQEFSLSALLGQGGKVTHGLLSTTAQDTLAMVEAVRDIQKENGLEGLHRYIISNATTKRDVENVYGFFLLQGYAPAEIDIDIVPLFETMEGMENAALVMESLYSDPLYSAHLARRGAKQTIMLGFSDGTKDGGYLTANWEIYRTKEVLTEVSRRFGIQVVFFDGRGGPPARGGGKTHDFYASQGPTIENRRIELTIQGQTITSVYGNRLQAQYNFGQLLAAAMESRLSQSPKALLDSRQRELISRLSELSFKKYTELKNHPLFVPYLENRSTLPYYGRTNIGSRPSKRGGGAQALNFQDLRAIPFVGSWSQLKQNVPGYFGFGSALRALKEAGHMEELKELYRNSAFFRTLVLNSMMSMNKSYFPLTSYMKKDPVYGGFWNILYEEYELSKTLMLELTGQTILQQDEPLSRKSVRMREKMVLPLLTIQQFALMQIQKGDPLSELYEKLVVRSLFGNINASRNSA